MSGGLVGRVVAAAIASAAIVAAILLALVLSTQDLREDSADAARSQDVVVSPAPPSAT